MVTCSIGLSRTIIIPSYFLDWAYVGKSSVTFSPRTMVHLGHSWTTCLLMKTINTRNCRQKRYCSYLASGCPRGWPVRGRMWARGADSWGAECPGTMPSPPPVRWTSSACRRRSRSARTPAAPSAPPSYAALCWWRRPAQETKPWFKHRLGQQEWGKWWFRRLGHPETPRP